MSINNERGFTIIEIILFLAISGALFAALMIGVGNGVTQQRYLDSVRSFKALIQDQYAAVQNTANLTNANQQCNSSSGAIVSGTPGSIRGASDCVIIGRAIIIRQYNGGKKVEVSSVTAPDKSNDDGAQNSNDVDVFANYFKPQLATFDQQIIDIDWQSQLKKPGNPMLPVNTEVILILRSPNTGLIRAFVTNNWTTSDLVDLVTRINATTPLEFCITNESTGLLPQQMITINPKIAGADAVKLDGGQGSQCRS